MMFDNWWFLTNTLSPISIFHTCRDFLERRFLCSARLRNRSNIFLHWSIWGLARGWGSSSSIYQNLEFMSHEDMYFTFLILPRRSEIVSDLKWSGSHLAFNSRASSVILNDPSFLATITKGFIKLEFAWKGHLLLHHLLLRRKRY